MIKINLLPVEKRRVEKTPLPRFLLLNAVIIICLLLGFWNGYILFKLQGKEKILAESKQRLTGLNAQVKDFDKMVSDENVLSQWSKSVAEVEKTRKFLWWEQVDQLWDVVQSAPTVWLTNQLRVDDAGTSQLAGTTPIEGVIVIDCLSAGDKPEPMGEFRIKLRSHPGLTNVFDMITKNPLNIEKVSMPDTTEGYALRFSMELARTKK
ncbi:MAG: hypothetical protein HY762_01365 [Planctomycetes bacterium]|nr:hypothetical protein [Planctomycetota bacterium]